MGEPRHVPVRSFHRWLPFHLGQGYGQEGYAAYDSRTDWWWYDRAWWQHFFVELRDAGFNLAVFWNVHPFPALIEFEQFPYANEFDADRRARNVENFRAILQLGREHGIGIALMQYHIHVSRGFARRHGIEFIPRNGYGGTDTPLVREYNAYCIDRLFQTYPQLSGLMTCFELNKDAFGYLSEAVLAPLKRHPQARLHFRLWGQHFPDEVQRVCQALPGRVTLWHKITEELICLPTVDPRIAWWHERFPDVPLHLLVGPGNAPGFNFLSRQFVDPEFSAAQFKALLRAGASGIGWFCCDDNAWIEEGELARQERAMEAWQQSSWMMRHVAGKVAANPDTTAVELASGIAEHFTLSPDSALRLLRGVSLASRADLPYWRLNSPYGGQELGLCGACGKLSLQTQKANGEVFRLAGPYVTPLHDWGIVQPDMLQSARSNDLAAVPGEVASQIEALAAQADELLNIPGAADGDWRTAADYGRLNVAVARFHAALIRAAAAAHRVPYARDFEDAVALLSAAADWARAALPHADAVARLCESIPVPRISQRPDLLTPHRLAFDWGDSLAGDIDLLASTRRHLVDNRNSFPAYRLYWQSHSDTYDLLRYLPTHGSHVNASCRDGAARIIRRAIDKAQASRSRWAAFPVPWLDALQDDLKRLDRPTLALGSGFTTGMDPSPVGAVNRTLHSLAEAGMPKIEWLSRTFRADLKLPGMLASIERPEALAFERRRVNEPAMFRVELDGERMRIRLCGTDSASPDLRVYGSTSAMMSRRIRLNLADGSAAGTEAMLVQPHALRFGNPFGPDVALERAGGEVTIGIRIAQLLPGWNSAEAARFNIGFGAAGPYWACVPDAYGDGILGYDPETMGLLWR